MLPSDTSVIPSAITEMYMVCECYSVWRKGSFYYQIPIVCPIRYIKNELKNNQGPLTNKH